ncbi:hypothetical protein WJX72_005212 [[Myrmecia] bisecta]|uniref:Alcohol dehydrogenase n=1 Tax=[Myrmecia] bisecta TaxID=41462 RepID=A0AAW1PW73_9CHLO
MAATSKQLPKPAADYCPVVTYKTKYDDSQKMKATEWHGKKDIRVNPNRPVPRVTDETDVILKVTNTCICGSDLHLYLGFFKGMDPGDVMGHEFMGTIHEIGSKGGQAEYVRVPLADVNLLAVPNSLRDEQVILLSDILPTAWWANECARTGKGDTVAIWGAGPVGTLAAHCAQNRGAKRVILIDQYAYRLEHAQKHLPGIEVIDFSKVDTVKALKELCPNGPDCGIECVGIHYVKSWASKAQIEAGLMTDPPDMLNEIIYCVKKGGRIGVVGVYAQDTNGFHIGAFMEKGQSMACGQTPCQKYWPELLKKVEKGELHPEMVITHQLALDDAPYAYKIFNDKLDNCKKCVLHPDWKSTRKAEE